MLPFARFCAPGRDYRQPLPLSSLTENRGRLYFCFIGREYFKDPLSAKALIQTHPLKTFSHTSQGPWESVDSSDWNDWKWQLRHRLQKLSDLETHGLNLCSEERQGAILADTKRALGITPYFYNMIDRENPDCPIRRQVIPRVEETLTHPSDLSDPCGEDSHSPVPGLVHRYPDRVLFLVTDRCAAYCRYCTRSRLVSNATGYGFQPDYERQIAYIREHKEIRDVLLSGGDPLLLSDDRLESLLSQIRAIPHV